ncbi:MAG: GAF domain-containing protein, partial [Anaerolineae bacterium]|nr:GAF domain-containing protein [Anaerolineae bacterium]
MGTSIRIPRAEVDRLGGRREEEELRRRDAILEAVGFIAERFLREDEWEESINDALARLGQAADVSRVYIFENRPGPDGEILTSQRYEWAAPGVTPQIDNPILQDFPLRAAGFARWIEELSRGNLICGHVRDFPASEHETLMLQNIVSIAVVTIFVEQQWWGFIGFDACTAERAWSAAETDALRIVASILGAAIQHQKIRAALVE